MSHSLSSVVRSVCVSVQTSFSNVLFVPKTIQHTYNGRCRSDLWEFRYKRFIRKLWRYWLTYSILQRYCSGILRNNANSSPNTAWNTIGKAASYFLFSLRLLPPYTQLSQRHASIIAPSYIRTCVGDALGMSLVTLDFPRVIYR